MGLGTDGHTGRARRSRNSNSYTTFNPKNGLPKRAFIVHTLRRQDLDSALCRALHCVGWMEGSEAVDLLLVAEDGQRTLLPM